MRVQEVKMLNLLNLFSIKVMLVVIILLIVKVICGNKNKFWVNYSKAVRTISIPFLMIIIVNFMISMLGGFGC